MLFSAAPRTAERISKFQKVLSKDGSRIGPEGETQERRWNGQGWERSWKGSWARESQQGNVPALPCQGCGHILPLQQAEQSWHKVPALKALGWVSALSPFSGTSLWCRMLGGITHTLSKTAFSALLSGFLLVVWNAVSIFFSRRILELLHDVSAYF